MVIDWEHHFIAEEIYQRRGIKAGQPMMKGGKIAGHMYDEVCQIVLNAAKMGKEELPLLMHASGMQSALKILLHIAEGK